MAASFTLLNVGSAGSRDVPDFFHGWAQHTLDIDAAVNPDVVCDARELRNLKAKQYDAIYCSHTLEHFYQHEVQTVLRGFVHLLKPTGFAHVSVPNMTALFEDVRGKDINDVWYTSAGGPITFHDVLYGWGLQMRGGNLYYSHKTGFTEASLVKALTQAGLGHTFTACDDYGNLYAFAFCQPPTKAQKERLGLCR